MARGSRGSAWDVSLPSHGLREPAEVDRVPLPLESDDHEVVDSPLDTVLVLECGDPILRHSRSAGVQRLVRPLDLVGRVQPVQDSPRPVREHREDVVILVNLEDGDVDVENAAVQESELNLIADLQDRARARAQGHRFELACPAGLRRSVTSKAIASPALTLASSAGESPVSI